MMMLMIIIIKHVLIKVTLSCLGCKALSHYLMQITCCIGILL